MGCRQNLKKEKRLRNRVNAFRFKKNSTYSLSQHKHAIHYEHTRQSLQRGRQCTEPCVCACTAGFVRFARPGSYSPEQAKKEAEDAEFFSLVRCQPLHRLALRMSENRGSNR